MIGLRKGEWLQSNKSSFSSCLSVKFSVGSLSKAGSGDENKLIGIEQGTCELREAFGLDECGRVL